MLDKNLCTVMVMPVTKIWGHHRTYFILSPPHPLLARTRVLAGFFVVSLFALHAAGVGVSHTGGHVAASIGRMDTTVTDPLMFAGFKSSATYLASRV